MELLSPGEALLYRNVTTRLQQLFAETLPPGAVVLVVSRGDESLVDLGSRGAPLSSGRRWCLRRPPPRRRAEAIAQLEAQRERGAGFLVIPEPTPGGSSTTPTSGATSRSATRRSRTPAHPASSSGSTRADEHQARPVRPAQPPLGLAGRHRGVHDGVYRGAAAAPPNASRWWSPARRPGSARAERQLAQTPPRSPGTSPTTVRPDRDEQLRQVLHDAARQGPLHRSHFTEFLQAAATRTSCTSSTRSSSATS